MVVNTLDTNMDSMYLENLDEYINDEGRIVTYKWLSLSLGVHTNVAKQMLFHYVSKQRNADKGDGLNVTYIVSGVVAGEDQQPDVQKMVLVREDNLDTVKSKMKDVISVHIYSVQKTKLKDMSVLYTANYDIVKEKIASINRYSGIECSNAKVRSDADLAKLHQQNAYQAPPEPAPLQKKAKSAQDKIVPKKEPDTDENASKQNSKQSGKPNQIASMFARQGVKSEVKTEEKKEISKPPSAGSKKTAGISAFFNKAPAAKKQQTPDSTKSSPVKSDSTKSSPVKSESTKDSPTTSDSSKYPHTESEAASSQDMPESLVSSIKTESQDSTTLESQTESMEVETSPPKKEKAKKQSKIKPKKATQKRGKSKRTDDETPIPKRKRIMVMSDSDSSSDGENEGDDESPFPASPVPEPVRIESDEEEEIPSTPQPEPKGEQLSRTGRPKKRKLVNKTFTDDDGYLVTQREYEYVTDSGEEEAAILSNEENIPMNSNSPKKTTNNSPTKKAANNSPTKKRASKFPTKRASSKSPTKKAGAKSPSKNNSKETKSHQKKRSKDVTKTKQASIMTFFGKK